MAWRWSNCTGASSTSRPNAPGKSSRRIPTSAKRRDVGFDQEADVKEVVEGHLPRDDHVAEGCLDRFSVPVGHENAPRGALPDIHQTRDFKNSEGLSDHGPADLKLPRKVLLRGEEGPDLHVILKDSLLDPIGLGD